MEHPGITGRCQEHLCHAQDLNNVLVPELFPWLPQRLDWHAHPGLGRRADAVGEFYFLHRCSCFTGPTSLSGHSLPAEAEVWPGTIVR